MSSDTEITPALTAEEWARFTADKRRSRVVIAGEECEYHRAAAIALRGQPFGFTREDVDTLDGAAKICENCTAWGRAAKVRAIAARIAALLPPEER